MLLVRLGKEAKNIQVIADVYWAILYVNILIQFIYDTNLFLRQRIGIYPKLVLTLQCYCYRCAPPHLISNLFCSIL